MDSRDERFLDAQRSFFIEADSAHFQWQTQNPLIAATERELLEGFPIADNAVVLEVGCGEGGNLANLLTGTKAGEAVVVGLDLFERKVTFAQAHVTRARFVCGDALSLPFRDNAFDAVLCRDLLHHVGRREPALAELLRVAKRGADIWIVEPNGVNPLMRLLALFRPHERGLLRNSPATLRDLIATLCSNFRIEVRQPMPIYRLLLHYQFGAPQLGRWGGFRLMMRAWERASSKLLPRRWWAYVLIKVRV